MSAPATPASATGAGPRRPLAGWEVHPVVVGGAAWSVGDLDDAAGRAALHAALDAGATCVDTAVAYTRRGVEHHGEALVGAVLAERGGPRPVVVTKCGHHREPDGTWGVDGRPQVLRRQVEGSLRALRTDVLDVVLLHHPDPRVPQADSLGALADLRARGLVREVGVSGVDADQLEGALEAAPVAVVQQVAPALVADPLLDALARGGPELGLAVMVAAPLGGPGALAARGRALEPLHRLASAWGATAQELLLLWLLHRDPRWLLVVGATRPATAAASVAVAARRPSPRDLDELDLVVRALRSPAPTPSGGPL